MNPVIIRTATGQHKPLIKPQSGFGGGQASLLPAVADDPCSCCATLLTCEQACQNPVPTITVSGLPFGQSVTATLYGSHTCDNVWKYIGLTISAEFSASTQSTIIWVENPGVCRWQDEFEGNLCSHPAGELPKLWGGQNCDSPVTIS